jgi:hypothetical protein
LKPTRRGAGKNGSDASRLNPVLCGPQGQETVNVAVPAIACLFVLLALRHIEMALVFCEVPKMFDCGWTAVDLRRPGTPPLPTVPGRGCTRHISYRVLGGQRIVFVSQEPLYRNTAGPLRGSITTVEGGARIVGRTSLTFFIGKVAFLAAVAWMWWPRGPLGDGSLVDLSIELVIVAIVLFFGVGALELRDARHHFMTDLAELEDAIGIRPLGDSSAA